jgi:uroporphyrinogen decarboxylase
MSYMIEGGGSPTLSRAKAWLYQHQKSSHHLLQAITDVCVDYLVRQVMAGAQMLQVFESHAGLLGHGLFLEFCLPYLEQIARKVKGELKKSGQEPVPMVSCPPEHVTSPNISTGVFELQVLRG